LLTGLRGRLAASLALISVITLGIVALALLTPLEDQLRVDEVDALALSGLESRAALAALPSDAFVPGDERLQRAVRSARRASLGDVVVVDARGTVLATTDPDLSERFPDAVAAARTGGSSKGIDGEGGESEARFAVAIEIGDRRYGLALRRSLDGAREAAAVVRREFEIAAGISLAVALLAGVVLSSGLTRRLGDLRDAVLRVAAVGPVAELQADDTRDEVGDLTRAFSEMQARLREQDQSRKSFIATASHELRTPLASLLLMLDLLRGDLEAEPADLADARVQAERAEAQAVRLSALAAQLLDLSRADASPVLLAENVALRNVAQSVLEEFAGRARAADVRLDLDASRSAQALGDPGAVAQILRILLDNGLRHAPAGSTLRVRTAMHAGRATLVVEDAGPGVETAERERIFERFERGSTASTSPGFGLGLAIGRELARRMHGDLVVDHGHPGGRFVLSLPVGAGG
jgi:signal transduction histidine kinase